MEELAEKCAGMTVTVGNAAENDEGGGVLAVQPVAGDDDTERVTLTTDQVNAGITATVTPKEGLAAPVTKEISSERSALFSGRTGNFFRRSRRHAGCFTARSRSIKARRVS